MAGLKFGRIGVALSVLLWASLVRAQGLARPLALAPLGPKPGHTVLDADQDCLRLEVKFEHTSGVRLRAGHLLSAHPEVEEIDRWLDSIGATRKRVFEQSEELLDGLRLAGEARAGRPLHDLNLFFRIECAAAGDTARVCDGLNAFGVVELAYPLGRVEDPVVHLSPAALFGAPDFVDLQGYRAAAPLGVDADYGNTFSGGIGTATLLADVETGWTDDHEDIAHKALGAYIGLAGAPYPQDHGAAVLGELIGANDGQGAKGLVYDSDVALSSHLGSLANVPTAVVYAVAAAHPGDFVILEVQCSGGVPGPFPCEYFPSTFAAVDTATANGIHVVAAAGNGNNNLDSIVYRGLFNRTLRDSGAILVGASNGSSLDKASFSNYGSRLDAHGWGFNVATCGFGDLFDTGLLSRYTKAFSGTSSATPIVTGAAVILNGIHRAVIGTPLDPLVLRATLTSTGTAQGTGGRIGPRPNVRKAIAALGLPRISVVDAPAVGSRYQILVDGPARSAYLLYLSPALRATPLLRPPSGYLLLDDPVLIGLGRLDERGEATFTVKVPAGALPGTLGFLQARVSSPSRGVAAYTNYVEMVLR
jgi:hypothetical protein